MPEKNVNKPKKEEILIYGAGGDPLKLIVQKTKPLFNLPYSLAEYKILDAYLSRINSHRPEGRTVVFPQGELERLLEVDRIRHEEMEKRLDTLLTTVTIKDPSEPKGINKLNLFSIARAYPDEDGRWQVTLQCTDIAAKYIFNIDSAGYIGYKLRNIAALNSRYSYLFYLYLYDNKYRRTWTIQLDDLKQIIQCKAPTYAQFKRFHDLIWKKVRTEICEKTDCPFSYELLKKGRTVTGVRINILEPVTAPSVPAQLAEQAEAEQTDAGQVTWEDIDVHNVPTDLMEQIYSNACAPDGEDGHGEFTLEEIRALISLISSLPASKLPPDTYGMGAEFQIEAYLRQKYRQMCAYAAKKPIKHRFSYLKKAIEKDVGIK